MKKFLAILMATILGVTLLAGCGGSTQTETQTQAATEALEETTQNVEGNVDADYSEDESKGSVEKQLRDIGKKAGKGETFGDTIKIAAAYGSNTFFPFQVGGRFGIKVSIFETLGNYDDEGNFYYILLKNCEQVDDTTYECEIWDNIHDSEGNEITADDIIFSFQQFIDNGNSGSVSKLDHLEKTGDYTFKWICTEAFGLGEFNSQFSAVPIVSQKAYEADPDHMANQPIGTGPYKLAEFSEGSYAVFEYNEDYWFDDITDEDWLAENDYVWTFHNYKTIRVDAIKDSAARAIALETGEVDACTKMDSVDIANYTANPDMGIKTINVLTDAPAMFIFNCSEYSQCQDENLRKAICYAIDSAGVAAGLDIPAFANYGIQPNMYDAPESWTTGEGRDYYNYNVEKAKEYLEKSSYNGETLTVLMMNNSIYIAVMTFVQAQLREVGINIELLPVEQSVTNEKHYVFDSGWDMDMETFGNGKYLPQSLRMFWSEDIKDTLNGLNVMGIEDKKLDELYVAFKDNYDEESLEAWDEYFTNEKAYAYSIISYYNQTACRDTIVPATSGAQRELTPGAFYPSELAD